MVRRHPLPPKVPGIWLFSDERARADLLALAALLPPGSGIVLRHDSLPPSARWRLLRRLMRLSRTRSLTVLLAGTPGTARRWGADGVHLRQREAHRARQAHALGLILTLPVHDAREARRAQRAGAHAAFVSPLHPTRSHPGAPALGRAAWLRLARLAGGNGAGWAAIDAWDEKAAKRRLRQKRKAVPT
jgi:thiamine-phosphate pyrophosphorylase